MNNVAKFIIIIGLTITLFGLLLLVFTRVKIPFIGRLPGDIFIKREKFRFYFPLTTSIIASIFLSLLLYLVSLFRK